MANRAGVQCPWTASNCPLFNPVFSDELINATRLNSPSQQQARTPNPGPSSPPILLPPPSTSSLNEDIKPSLLQSLPEEAYDLSPVVPDLTHSSSYAPEAYSYSPAYPTPPLPSLVMPQTAQTPRTVAQQVEEDAQTRASINSSLDMLLNNAGGGYLVGLEDQPQQQQQQRASGIAASTGSVSSPEESGRDVTAAHGGVRRSGRSSATRSRAPTVEPNSDEEDEAHSPQSTHNDDGTEVTPFISKLVHLLNHTEYAPYIRWNRAGTAFVFCHGSPQLLDIFTRFFRHSNVQSFVRQLNIYGFVRCSTLSLLSYLEDQPTPGDPYGLGGGSSARGVPSPSEYSAFSHTAFWRDEPGGTPCDLSRIKPKRKPRKTAGGGKGRESARAAGSGGAQGGRRAGASGAVGSGRGR